MATGGTASQRTALCFFKVSLCSLCIFGVVGIIEDAGGSCPAVRQMPDGSCREGGVSRKPHILFMVIDDLGYNDVGYHQNKPTPINPKGYPTTNASSLVRTPVIDRLASESIRLENYYVQALCAPTRAAFMTGRYSFHTGIGPWVITNGQPYGLPGDEVTLAELLSAAGYSTHLVGKWHLGMQDERFTPTFRGFDSFQGFLGSHETYFDHLNQDFLDFYESDLSSVKVMPKITDKYNGAYSADIFVSRVEKIVKAHENTPADMRKPLFIYLCWQNVHSMYTGAPKKYLKHYKGEHFKNPLLQMYMAMVEVLDVSVGRVEKIFQKSGLWNDTVLVFTTDNGGSKVTQTWPGGSNYPLRGGKFEDWEGGIRGVAFVRGSSNHPIPAGTETLELMHATDWLPTIAYLAGASTTATKPLDGYNIWQALAGTGNTSRTSIVHDCPGFDSKRSIKQAVSEDFVEAVYRRGPYKLMYESTVSTSMVKPNVPQYQQWNFFPLIASRETLCRPPPSYRGVYLFNIEKDPLECTNLAGKADYDKVLNEMQEELETHRRGAIQDLAREFSGSDKKSIGFDSESGKLIWRQYECSVQGRSSGTCGYPMR